MENLCAVYGQRTLSNHVEAPENTGPVWGVAAKI